MSVLLVLALFVQSVDFLTEGNRALDAQQYERALDLFQKASAADPKDPAAAFQLALTHSILGHDADAIQSYRATLELEPGMYEAQFNLGLLLLRSQDSAGALPYLEAAIAKKPTLTGESALARALMQQKRYVEAEAHYRKAVELDPARREDLLDLAVAYEEDRKVAEAIRLYREFPKHAVAQYRLGLLLKTSGDTAEATTALEASVAQSPTVENLLALAQAYLAEKRIPEADAAAARATAAEPKDVEIRLFYGRILRDQRKFPAAAAQFLAATQIKPDSREAWNELAAALTIAEQYPQALMALDKAAALGDEIPGNLFFRALVLDRLEQRPAALAAYERFLEASKGKFPNQEFQARGRIRTIERELKKNR